MSNWKANRLRVLRAERRLTQREVAARMGISQAQYSNLENGYSEPSAKELDRIAAIFGVPVDALIAVAS